MDLPAPEDPVDPEQRATIATLAAAYLSAVLAGDVFEAERVVRVALEAGLPEATIGGDVIAPAMRDVGERWARGELSVADEHLATEVSTRVVALQREHFRMVARRSARRVLLLAPEGEQHVLGLQMAESVLVHAGYDVRMLGADVPLDALGPALRRHEPAVVGLTIGTADSALTVRATVDLVRDARPAAGVVVGGRASGDLVAIRPGIATCEHVGDALEIVDALAQHAELN